MPGTFSIGEAFSVGWSRFKSNMPFWIGVTVAMFLVQGILQAIQPIGGGSGQQSAASAIVSLIVSLISSLVSVFVSMALITVALRAVDGESLSASDLFSTSDRYINFLIASVVMGIAVFIGFILLVVPGIILGVRLSFFTYFIIDRGSGPIEALKESWALTSGFFWKLLGFYIVAGLLNLVGLAILLVGLLVTSAVTVIADAVVYRKLTGASVAV